MSIRNNNAYTKFRGIDLMDSGNAARGINFPDQTTARTYGANDRVLFVEGGSLKYWSGASATTLGTVSGGSGNMTLNDAYDDGNTVTVDASAVVFAGSHATNNVFEITGTAATAGNLIDITNSGTGKDIDGTSSTWFVTKEGAPTFTGTVTCGDIVRYGAGADQALTINAKGTGTIGIGSTSTGAVTITPALTAVASVTITGAAGSNKLTVSAGDAVIGDGSLLVSDDDNAASFTVQNSAATTVGAVASGGVAKLACPSLTTGALLSLELTEGTLNGGWYVRAWDVTGSAQVFSVGEDGITTIAGAGGSNVLTLTAGDMVMSDGSLTITDADNAATLSVTNNTVTTAPLVSIAGSGVHTGTGANSFISITPSGLTTGSAMTITANAATGSQGVFKIEANSITTGTVAYILTSANLQAGASALKVIANAALACEGIITATGTALTSGWLMNLTGGGANALANGGVVKVDAGAATVGSALKLTTTGVYTGTTGVINLDATSATTGTLIDVAGTGLTSGTALKLNATEATLTTGKYIDCYDGAASDFTVAKYGATVIAGNASGTASLTQTAGDHVLTSGHIVLTNGSIKAGVQDLSGAGAVDVTHMTTSVATTGADALTLADGAVGQFKSIVMITKVGNATLTPVNLHGYTTITFTAVGQSVLLQFIGTKWAVVANNGTTLA